MARAEEQIPAQQTGRQTDFAYDKTFETEKAAHAGFLKAADRLTDVSNWHEYAGPGSSKFCLTNNLGGELVGRAKEGFYFNINLPVPGSDAGDGLEWVMIEKMTFEGNESTDEEYITMTVRPVPNPKKDEPEIAHFYKEASTSTFIIARKGKIVTAGIHGRNESPNNTNVDLHDKIRNTIVALSARAGFSGPQWKMLAQGLIEYDEKAKEKTKN
jgi:hypothetical protein